MLKKTIVICFLATTALFATAVDSIAAVVGTKVILESELQQLVTYLRLTQGDTVSPDSLLRQMALRRMIDEALLSEQAEKESIEVSRDEVVAAVTENINLLKERFASEAEFKSALLAEGLNEKLLRERIGNEVRRNLIARRLLEKAGLTQIYISPTEAEQFYNEHKDSIARVPGRVTLAHILILIKPADSAEQAARQRATEVIDLIARGGEFATLARSFSDDKKTSSRGGDWGWLDSTQLSPELKLVLTQLQPGQVSPPFRLREGYCIAQLTARDGSRYRFRTILIAVPLSAADTARARATARRLRSMAQQGVSFDSLAKRFSDDPETGPTGGFLGEFMIEGLLPPFDQTIARLDSGEISEPILSEHGFHIIKLLAKEPGRTLSFLELQDAIRNYLYEQRFSERLRQFLDRIEQKIYVEVKGRK